MAYRNYATAVSHIVDATGQGDFTTIGAALTAASSGQTIFIRSGTYTENPTLVAGVNLCAFECDFQNNVIINGKCTLSTAGIVSISGIQLQTNSDYCVSITGSAASSINLTNCFLNSTNNTALNNSSSNSVAIINCYQCQGNLGTTGISFGSSSSPGAISFDYCNLENSGGSSTATTASAGTLAFRYTRIVAPISSTSTAALQILNCNIFTSGTNTTGVTCGGSGNNFMHHCFINSGSASGVSIGSSLDATNNCISSTNTNAITGAGTLVNGGISFVNSSYKINTTTQTVAEFDVGGISFDGGTNLLQNYATGTWTPTLTGASTAGSTTYSTQTGYYTRIGNSNTLWMQVIGSAATGTGTATVGGLPFTVNANAPSGLGGIAFGNNTNWTWPASTTSMAFEANSNNVTGQFFASASGSPFGTMNMTNHAFNMTGTVTHQI